MYLIDSNIIIYHFKNMPQATQFLSEHRGRLCISTMTVSEILSFAVDDDVLTVTEKFLTDNFVWLDISRAVILKTAELRRQKKTKTPDAIIAATALLHDCTLVTRNQKDFHHLPLTPINPIDEQIDS